MNRYRIIENKKDGSTWHTVQMRLWLFCWSYLIVSPDGFEEVAEWATYEAALSVVNDRLHGQRKAEREVVYDSGR